MPPKRGVDGTSSAQPTPTSNNLERNIDQNLDLYCVTWHHATRLLICERLLMELNKRADAFERKKQASEQLQLNVFLKAFNCLLDLMLKVKEAERDPELLERRFNEAYSETLKFSEVHLPNHKDVINGALREASRSNVFSALEKHREVRLPSVLVGKALALSIE